MRELGTSLGEVVSLYKDFDDYRNLLVCSHFNQIIVYCKTCKQVLSIGDAQMLFNMQLFRLHTYTRIFLVTNWSRQ